MTPRSRINSWPSDVEVVASREQTLSEGVTHRATKKTNRRQKKKKNIVPLQSACFINGPRKLFARSTDVHAASICPRPGALRLFLLFLSRIACLSFLIRRRARARPNDGNYESFDSPRRRTLKRMTSLQLTRCCAITPLGWRRRPDPSSSSALSLFLFLSPLHFTVSISLFIFAGGRQTFLS